MMLVTIFLVVGATGIVAHFYQQRQNRMLQQQNQHQINAIFNSIKTPRISEPVANLDQRLARIEVILGKTENPETRLKAEAETLSTEILRFLATRESPP